MIDRDEHLQQTLTALRARWGASIIRRLGEQQGGTLPTLSTGYPALDAALEIGGLPQGRLIEFSGQATSGITTLAWRTMAQLRYGPIVYIDPQQTFDPVIAADCGVDLSRLLLTQPPTLSASLQLAGDVILVYGDIIPLLVMDLPGTWLKQPTAIPQIGTTLSRLIAPLSRHCCTLLVLVTWPADEHPLIEDDPLAQYMALRLHARRKRWRYRRRDVAAYDVQVDILKHKLGAAPRQLTLTIIPEQQVTSSTS